MSTAKRSRQRHSDARAASPPPPQKRLKTSKNAHVPARGGLDFLVDENARHGKQLEARLTNGVPSAKTTRVDESHAVVASDTRDQDDKVGGTQDNAIGISSGEEESSEDSSEESDDGLEGDDVVDQHVLKNGTVEQPLTNGHVSEREDIDGKQDAVGGAEDVEMAEHDDEGDAEIVDAQVEEPSFGDMLQARHPEPIDIQAHFPDPMADRQALIPASGSRVLSAPSGTSLGTVLTQALKTNDKDLLESCFSTTDLPSIRSTIQRLQSRHVATMLQRLAERIHKRPGRTGNLMVWVQWSLVAHGGYLAGQPEVMQKLRPLMQVIRQRAEGLKPLLQLKGKLDMLSAQLELRRNMQAASRAANAEDDEDEEGVVYIEGKDEDWSDSDDGVEQERVNGNAIQPPIPKSGPQTATPRTNDSSSSDSDDDMPNGVVQEEEDDESNADEDEEGAIDMEAEETSDDDDNEEGEDSDEDDTEPESDDESGLSSDNESDGSGIQQPKPSTLNRKR